MIDKLRQTLSTTLGRFSGRARPAARHGRLPVPEYAAVSICSGAVACEAARRYNDQRMLRSQVPPLPLPGCDQRRCECSFAKHPDRRGDDDRRSPFANTLRDHLAGHLSEQRATSDRRKRRGARTPRPRAYFNDYDS